MPTISQLPLATSVSAADEVLISQGGTARATLVGALLASAQPAITIDPPSLIGRTSLGSGGPEQVDVGVGINLSGGTLVADGSDHAVFPIESSFSIESDLVISNQGRPMLMRAALLRGLFSAGTNVAIDPNGLISTTVTGPITGTGQSGSSISQLQVVTALAAQDLVAVSHTGKDYAITYGNLLGGVTIDQAQAAGPASDSDTIWVAQGSNVMASQTFSDIWAWIANKLPTYKAPIVEITTSVNLDATLHNGRIVVCSQPITLSPSINNMGSGFQCTVINASSGDLTLGTGFVSSTGSQVLASWQSATLSCATYSGGTIAFAAMPAVGFGYQSARPGDWFVGIGHHCYDDYGLLAGPDNRGRHILLYRPISADWGDIVDQQRTGGGRNILPNYRTIRCDKLRHRRRSTKCDRPWCRIRHIDRRDSKWRAAKSAATSERCNGDPDNKQYDAGQLVSPDRRERSNQLHSAV